MNRPHARKYCKAGEKLPPLFFIASFAFVAQMHPGIPAPLFSPMNCDKIFLSGRQIPICLTVINPADRSNTYE
jgi:hypothetical protein